MAVDGQRGMFIVRGAHYFSHVALTVVYRSTEIRPAYTSGEDHKQ